VPIHNKSKRALNKIEEMITISIQLTIPTTRRTVVKQRDPHPRIGLWPIKAKPAVCPKLKEE